MREKFIKFMEGRYGVDAFARFTMGVAFVMIILSMFIRSRVGAAFDTIGLLAILYTYYRMLSRDIQKRYAENQKYLSITSGIRQKFNREKNIIQKARERSRLTVRNATRNLSKKAEYDLRSEYSRRSYVWLCGNE